MNISTTTISYVKLYTAISRCFIGRCDINHAWVCMYVCVCVCVSVIDNRDNCMLLTIGLIIGN